MVIAASISSADVSEVSGVLVRALADTAMRYEVAPSALMEGQHASLATGTPLDVRVALPTFTRLLQRAAALTGEPSFALLCGFEASECAFDLLAPLVSHVPTLRHAIEETNQFHALVIDNVRARLTHNGSVAQLRCEFPRSYDATDRGVSEFLVGGLLRLLRGFGCTRSELHAAYFEHARPPRSQAYARIFQGRERFSQAVTGLDFAAHLLDRTHLHANPELQTAAHMQAERHLRRLSQPMSFAESLRRYLINQPPPGVPDMVTAARALDLSVRSLRRKLASVGMSYRALVQEMQAERACLMLRNPETTVQTVAGTLGFEDTAAFHRAFRRWTGMSAREYAESRLPAQR